MQTDLGDTQGEKIHYKVYCPTEKASAFEKYPRGAALEVCPVCNRPLGKPGTGCDFQIAVWNPEVYNNFLCGVVLGNS